MEIQKVGEGVDGSGKETVGDNNNCSMRIDSRWRNVILIRQLLLMAAAATGIDLDPAQMFVTFGGTLSRYMERSE